MVLKEKLNKLRDAIDRKMDELRSDFWDNEEIPSYCEEDGYISIVNPFYSECFRFEVNPFEYYNMTMEDMEKFFEYYGIR